MKTGIEAWLPKSFEEIMEEHKSLTRIEIDGDLYFPDRYCPDFNKKQVKRTILERLFSLNPLQTHKWVLDESAVSVYQIFGPFFGVDRQGKAAPTGRSIYVCSYKTFVKLQNTKG
jgi:hypothetical protein